MGRNHLILLVIQLGLLHLLHGHTLVLLELAQLEEVPVGTELHPMLASLVDRVDLTIPLHQHQVLHNTQMPLGPMTPSRSQRRF